MKKSDLEIKNIITLGSQSIWAIIDQLFFAGTNFIINILFARWFDSATYGFFSSAYAFFLLLATIHTSLGTEPMMIYGSSTYSDKSKSYYYLLQRYHWIFGVCLSIILLLVSFFLDYLNLRGGRDVIFGLSIGTPLILYLWFVRRICYIVLSPQMATIGGVVYMAICVGGMFILSDYNLLNPGSVFILMGGAGYISAKIIIYLLGTKFVPDTNLSINDIKVHHWEYGKQALLASAFSWIPSNFLYLLVPLILDINASAVIRALYNFVTPALQLIMALAGLYVPWYSRVKSHFHLRKAVFLSTIFMLVLTFGYWLFLLFFGKDLMRFLYFDRYLDYLDLLRYFGLIPILVGVGSMYSALLRVLKRPDLIAKFYGIGALVFILAFYPLLSLSGLRGGIYMWLLSQGIMTVGVVIGGTFLIWRD